MMQWLLLDHNVVVRVVRVVVHLMDIHTGEGLLLQERDKSVVDDRSTQNVGAQHAREVGVHVGKVEQEDQPPGERVGHAYGAGGNQPVGAQRAIRRREHPDQPQNEEQNHLSHANHHVHSKEAMRARAGTHKSNAKEQIGPEGGPEVGGKGEQWPEVGQRAGGEHSEHSQMQNEAISHRLEIDHRRQRVHLGMMLSFGAGRLGLVVLVVVILVIQRLLLLVMKRHRVVDTLFLLNDRHVRCFCFQF
mmetsp:Transcript_38117/g.95911  ORF Transcript_38117/g.95911 Transcript_38117/m.95911 type:complete len:246 (-) Transcript_38117:85-822(-)